MTTKFKAIAVLTSFILVTFILVSFDNPRIHVSQGSLGEIRYSLLTPDDFIIENGKGWVLMDADVTKKLEGSVLKTKYGIGAIPDARGLFLRGKNNGRNDGKQDLDGERTLGHYQEDAFQTHGHRFMMRKGYDRAGDGSISSSGVGNGNIDYDPDGVSKMTVYGGRNTNETRPRNVAVNIFIKIND